MHSVSKNRSGAKGEWPRDQLSRCSQSFDFFVTCRGSAFTLVGLLTELNFGLASVIPVDGSGHTVLRWKSPYGHHLSH